MIARAWLTEAAEHSIDVQYFIFSADNVGSMAPADTATVYRYLHEYGFGS